MAVKTVKAEFTLNEKFKLEGDVHGHKMVVDQPANAGGTDAGPTPLDYLFAAHAGCLGTVARIIAMQKKLPVRGIRISVEGDINTDGLLGKPTDDPIGFKEIRVTADVDGDLTKEEKETLLHDADRRCPVSFNLQNSTPVKITVA